MQVPADALQHRGRAQLHHRVPAPHGADGPHDEQDRAGHQDVKRRTQLESNIFINFIIFLLYRKCD